jgi:hypothetical protein
LIGNFIVDVGAEHDYTILEESREDVATRVETALKGNWKNI